MPELSKELQERLSANLPDTVSCNNPVDLVGDASAERYGKAIKPLIDSDEVDILLFLCTPQAVTDMEEIHCCQGSRDLEPGCGKETTGSCPCVSFDPLIPLS